MSSTEQLDGSMHRYLWSMAGIVGRSGDFDSLPEICMGI